MYQITCDGLPLMDFRDNDLVLVNPKVSLEVNTVGEGSFTIYKNHPHYSKLKKLKSVFEVSDDHGVIFRGRATGDTVDFNQGMLVDMEGAMAYFNDSIVRSFNFPGDFEKNAEYIKANQNGDRVAFFLGWLINNHNSQVQDFQKMKLGNVTVKDPNFVRSNSEYASTWEMLKAKLFDSALGGYLCIRYEEDGNYIDYLSAFTETNSQEIVFGENLLDLKSETEASKAFSAIIPIGALALTIEGLADKDITDDIVKSGDTLYSKKAVEEFGWIYAPIAETTWDDVVDDADLLQKGVNWLANGIAFMNAMEATAVDLHFTNEQVESLRIYKNVNVRSVPHGVAEGFPLAKLVIDLLNPQNTKITVGKTLMTLTEQTILLQEEAKKRYSKLSKTDEQILMEVVNVEDKMSTSLRIGEDGVTITDAEGNAVSIDGKQVKAGSITARQIAAESITGDKVVANIELNAPVITGGEIHGTDIYGSAYHDADGLVSFQLLFRNDSDRVPGIIFQEGGSSNIAFGIYPVSDSEWGLILNGRSIIGCTTGGTRNAYGNWTFSGDVTFDGEVDLGDGITATAVFG